MKPQLLVILTAIPVLVGNFLSAETDLTARECNAPACTSSSSDTPANPAPAPAPAPGKTSKQTPAPAPKPWLM